MESQSPARQLFDRPFRFGFDDVVSHAEVGEVVEVNRPRFDAVSFRVWKEDVDHAEEDSRGAEAAS
ncbi:hypothetical protein ACIQLJ_14320, partial [Microbacterium sp. NPDC091313]